MSIDRGFAAFTEVQTARADERSQRDALAASGG